MSDTHGEPCAGAAAASPALKRTRPDDPQDEDSEERTKWHKAEGGDRTAHAHTDAVMADNAVDASTDSTMGGAAAAAASSPPAEAIATAAAPDANCAMMSPSDPVALQSDAGPVPVPVPNTSGDTNQVPLQSWRGSDAIGKLEWIRQQPRCVEVCAMHLRTLWTIIQQMDGENSASAKAPSTPMRPVSGRADASGSPASTPLSASLSLSSPLFANVSGAESDALVREAETQLSVLEQRLVVEHESETTRAAVHKLRGSMQLRQSRQALQEAQLLCDIVAPFDVYTLVALLHEQDAANRQHVAGAHIALMIGSTGVGKSTTIQWLAGSEMEECVESNGLPHIRPKRISNPAAIDVHTSSTSRSVTRFLKAVPVTTGALGSPAEANRVLVLVDAPGLADTRGAEIDVANSISILQAVQRCASARLVVFVSFPGMGERGEGVRDLARMVSGLVRNVEDVADSITFAFTHCPKAKEGLPANDPRGNVKLCIHNRLVDILDQSQDDPDQHFRLLLEKMVESTEDDGALIIDPLAPKKIAAAFLRRLHKTKPITDSGAFEMFTSARSRDLIQKQVDRLKLSIHAAVTAEEVTLVQFRLNMMQWLSDHSGQPIVAVAMNEMLGLLDRWIRHVFDECSQRISDMRSHSHISASQVQACVRDIGVLHATESLAKQLGDRYIHPQALLQKLAAIMRDEGAVAAGLTTNDVDQSEAVLLYLTDLRLLIEGLGGAGLAFAPLTQQLQLAYQKAVDELLAVVEQWRQAACQAVTTLDFDSFCVQLARIAPMLERFHAHIPVADRERVGTEVATARCQLVEALEARVHTSTVHLQQLGNRDAAADALSQLQQLSALLQAATNSSMLQLQLGKETLSKLSRDFSQRCVSRFESVVAEVEAAAGASFAPEIPTASGAVADAPMAPSPDQSSPPASGSCADKSNLNSLEQIEPLILQLQQLQTIPGVDLLVAPTWHRLVQRVLSVVKDARLDAEELLRRLSSPSDKSDRAAFYTRFARCINVLRDAKWVERLQSGVCDVVLVDIFAQVEHHADMVCKEMERLDLSVERGSLAGAVDCVQQVNLLQPLEGIMPELGERRKNLYATFETSVKETIQQLMHTFDLQKASVSALHKRVDELDQLRLRYAANHPAALFLQQHGLANESSLQAAVEAAHKACDEWKVELLADLQQRRADINCLTQLNARIVTLEAAQSARAEGMGAAVGNLFRKAAGQSSAQTEEAAQIQEELDSGGFATTRQLTQAQKKQKADLKTAEAKGNSKQEELEAEHQRLLNLTQELARLQSAIGVTEAESAVLRDSESDFPSVVHLDSELKRLRDEVKSIEEQGLTHVMAKLDVEWAERALDYVCTVEAMPWKHDWLGNSKPAITAYLQCYVDQLCKVILRNLDQTVKPTAQKGTYRHLFGLAQRVLEGVKELEAASAKTRLAEWFKPTLVSDFKAILSRHLGEVCALMEDLSSTRKTAQLELQLSITQALIQLDPYIHTPFNFAELNRTHRAQLGKLNSAVLQTSMKAIEANNFAAIASELGTLAQGELQGQAQFVIDSVQQPLSSRIQDLISELHSRIAVLVVPLNCHTTAVQEVSQALKLLKNAKAFVIDYLSKPVQDELGKSCLDAASRALCTKMRQSLDCIRRSLDANNFREAEQMLQSLQTAHELLASYCGEVQSDVESVRASFATKLDAKVRYWQDMPLAQYLSDPPKDILEKLKLMADSDGTYGPSFSQLKDAIRNKYQQELNEAREEKTPALRNRKLRLCKSVLRVLPDFLHSFLKLELKNLCAELQEEEKASETELTTAMQLKDYASMRVLMETFKSNGVLSLNALAHEGVTADARQLKHQVDECLNAMHSDIHKRFECMHSEALKLQQLDGELGALVPAVRTVHRQMEERVKFAFENTCDELRKLMMHHGHQLSYEVRDLLERNLVIFILFCAAGNAAVPSHPSLFSTLVSSTLVHQTDQHLHSFLSTQEERFRAAMATQPLQISLLKEALDAAQLLAPFHVKLRDYTMMLRSLPMTMRSAPARSGDDGNTKAPMEVDEDKAAVASPAAAPRASKSKKSASRKSAAVAPAPAPAPAASIASSGSAGPADVSSPVPLLSVLQREAYTYSALQSQVRDRLGSLVASAFHSIQDSASHSDPSDPDFSISLKERQLQLSSLKDASQLQAHVQLDSGDSYPDLCAALRLKLDELVLALQTASAKQPMVRSDFDLMRLNHTFLASHATWVHVFQAELKAQLAQIDDGLLGRVDKHLAKFISLPITDSEQLAKHLVAAKALGCQLPWLKARVSSKLDDALDGYELRSRESPLALSHVGVQLEILPPFGSLVIEEHGVFQGYYAKITCCQVHAQDIHYTLHPDNLKGDSLNIPALAARFSAFDTQYKELLKKYYFIKGDVAQLIQECKDVARNSGAAKQAAKLSRSRKKGVFAVSSWWTQSVRSCVPSLLAHLCALWSVRRCAKFSEADRAGGCWVQPLAPQVIAIFRLLGCDQDASVTTELFSNNLCQILTGEGKSVTLAMVSMILALLGARVSCACYSAYLSARDLTDFLPMFTELGVHEQIHYGSFNQVCEKFINGGGDVRQAVIDMIAEKKDDAANGASASASPAAAAAPSSPAQARGSDLHILLIDEVDVLFQESFFGNVYTPLACLKHASIVELVRDVWSVCSQQPTTRPSARSFQSRPSFQGVLGAFPRHEALLVEALKDMLNDAQHFEHDYEVRQDQIAYREHDGYSTTATIGYKTMFAAMHHNLTSKDDYACINLHCGSFSYADLPLQFDRVMGVTGTLTTLSAPEKAIVRDTYGIHKQTLIPSAYGANQRTFAREGDGVQVENVSDWHNAIKVEIENRGLAAHSGAGERAALVCFETEERLESFRKSAPFALFCDRAEVLTEATPPGEKERIVQAATHAGSITLFTRPFGRGTDFKCRDPGVKERGGVHMIQTFLAESLSEETQLQGRCARQGDKGSYAMVLLDTELEKFDISSAEILAARGQNRLYALLHKKREDVFLRGYANRSLLVANARDEHQQALCFLSHLRAGDVANTSAFLLARNRGTLATTSRTIVAMDATYSMSSLLQQAKLTVGDTFQRAALVLQEAGLDPQCFELQFVVYRNYNAERVIEVSSWESKPNHLRTFIDRMEVDGGMGPEAIEIALQHCNTEADKQEVAQVILIGDAPANSATAVARNRTQFLGDDHWTSLFGPVTDWREQVQRLVTKNVRVHTFPLVGGHLEADCSANFQQIASLTNGRTAPLDVRDPQSSQQLTDLLTETVLQDAGREKGGELVAAYRAKFVKSYKQ